MWQIDSLAVSTLRLCKPSASVLKEATVQWHQWSDIKVSQQNNIYLSRDNKITSYVSTIAKKNPDFFLKFENVQKYQDNYKLIYIKASRNSPK